MNPATEARQILETLLGQLGFPAQIEEEQSPMGPVLQVTLENPHALIGENAERLEDLQYLVNRLLQKKFPDAPKVRVDVAHVREMKEDEMLEAVRAAADQVRATHQPIQLPPMNSFHRRLVHQIFAEDPAIKTYSKEGGGRLKRLSLIPRDQL